MPAPRHDVTAIGNAIVDLQVAVADPFLDVVSLARGSMTLSDGPKQQALLDALDGHEIHRSSGGSAANTVAGLAELGGTAAHCCKVGDDDLGTFYLEDLRRVGVSVAERRGAGATGTSVVMITPDAQRTMLTHLGVSADLGVEDVDVDAIAASRWLYVEGYLLPQERTREAALAGIVAARKHGVRVALTVSDPFCVAAAGELIWTLLDGSVDLLFCNEVEARALTGHDDPIDCAQALHRVVANVALTLGAKGSILMHEREAFPVAGVPVAAVDTTGAGDMYAAGVLYGITHGLSWPVAGHLASHAAARVVSHLGARLPRRFTPHELRALCEIR